MTWTRWAAALTVAVVAAGAVAAAPPATAADSPLTVSVDRSPYGLLFTVATIDGSTLARPTVTASVRLPGASHPVESATVDVCQQVFNRPVACTSNRFRVHVGGLLPDTTYEYTIEVTTIDGPVTPVTATATTYALPEVHIPGATDSNTPHDPAPDETTTPTRPAARPFGYLSRSGTVRGLTVDVVVDRGRAYLLVDARAIVKVTVAVYRDRWVKVAASVRPQALRGQPGHVSVRVPKGKTLRVAVTTTTGRAVVKVPPAR